MTEVKKMAAMLNTCATTEAKADSMSSPKFTARQARLCEAFTRRDAIWREDIDRIAGASNGPEIMRQLKLKGLQWKCDRQKRMDRDGNPCEPGIYSIVGSGWETLQAWGFV